MMQEEFKDGKIWTDQDRQRNFVERMKRIFDDLEKNTEETQQKTRNIDRVSGLKQFREQHGNIEAGMQGEQAGAAAEQQQFKSYETIKEESLQKKKPTIPFEENLKMAKEIAEKGQKQSDLVRNETIGFFEKFRLRFDANIQNLEEFDKTLSFTQNPEEVKNVIKNPQIWREIDMVVKTQHNYLVNFLSTDGWADLHPRLNKVLPNKFKPVLEAMSCLLIYSKKLKK